MIEWFLFAYFAVALIGFIIGLTYGGENNSLVSLTFGLVWPALIVVWVLRKI